MLRLPCRLIIWLGIYYGRISCQGAHSLLADRSNAWKGYWTVLYPVAGAIVTLVASGKLLPRYRWLASSLAAVGFLVFAAGNYHALDSMRVQRNAVVAFVKEKAANSPQIAAIAEASAPPTQTELRVYHWGLCLFVVVLLFAIPPFQQPPKMPNLSFNPPTAPGLTQTLEGQF